MPGGPMPKRQLLPHSFKCANCTPKIGRESRIVKEPRQEDSPSQDNHRVIRFIHIAPTPSFSLRRNSDGDYLKLIAVAQQRSQRGLVIGRLRGFLEFAAFDRNNGRARSKIVARP